MSATSIIVNVGARTSEAVRELGKVNKALGDQATTADKAGRAVKSASIPATAALAGLGAAAAVSVKAASDLGETFNAVGKTFGPAADQITAFGETAAEATGLSQRAFQELATSTGALLTNMGYSQDEAAESTINLAQRAADMASVFNTDVDTALSAINAGLRGESEPLRAFGVGLSDAALKSQAMAMGIYDGTGALDASQKALATEALVLEETSKYAGDFADTSDSMANAQRTVQAQTEDLAAEFGQVLLPYIEDGIGLLKGLLGWVEDNTGAVKAMVAIVGGLSAAIVTANAVMRVWSLVTLVASAAKTVAYYVIIGTVRVGLLAWSAATKAMAAVQWLLNAALSANPIGLVIALVAGLVAAVVIAYKRSDAFRKIVDKMWKVLKTLAKVALAPVIVQFKIMSTVIKTVWDWVSRLISKVGDLVRKLNPLKGLGSVLGNLNPFSSSAAATGARLAPVNMAGATALRTGAQPLTGGGSSTSGPVTINVYGSGDPFRTASTIKRALEGNDIVQGRPRGVPLALAW